MSSSGSTRVKPHGITAGARGWLHRNVRWVFFGTACAVVGGFLLLQGFNWAISARQQQTNLPQNGFEPAAYTTAVATPAAPKCLGVVCSVSLGSDPLSINPTGAYAVYFEVTSGTVRFEGTHGLQDDWSADQAPMPNGEGGAVGKKKGTILTARALTNEAELDYILCPAGSSVVGRSCS